MRILVSAAGKHGATREIAERIGSVLAARGHEVDVREPEDVTGVDGYDAAVLGSAVYAGHWLGPARELAEAHEAKLRGLPVWLFSSGPVGAPDPKPEGDPEEVPHLLEALEARGHEVFAGRLDRKLLGLAERAIVRALRAPEGDFRHWPAIEAWAGEIAAELAERPAA